MKIQLKFPYKTLDISFDKGRVFDNVKHTPNGYYTGIIVQSWFEYYGNTWYPEYIRKNWKIGINITYNEVFIPNEYAEILEEI